MTDLNSTKNLSAKEKYLEFIKSVQPTKDFISSTHPEEPNYLDSLSWAALPGRDGFHNLSPDTKPSLEIKDFDVFYIHPTGYFQQYWNSPIDHESAAYERTGSHLATQASAFSATCNVYAPYYRQSTYYSFFDTGSNGSQALDLAYSDISNAFNIFVQEHSNGRPFFIAGHSQGALHGQRLVHEYISGKSLAKNFIAAYLIGYILPVKYFHDMYPDLSISQSSQDQKVIISWCTGIQGFRRSRANAKFWTPVGWKSEPMEQPLVCQNPFSWTDQGEWIDDPNNISIRLKSDKLSLANYYATKNTFSKLSIDAITNLEFQAKVSKNYMIETRGPLIDKIRKFSVEGDLHNFDMSLFWGAIRNNIKVRADAYNE